VLKLLLLLLLLLLLMLLQVVEKALLDYCAKSVQGDTATLRNTSAYFVHSTHSIAFDESLDLDKEVSSLCRSYSCFYCYFSSKLMLSYSCFLLRTTLLPLPLQLVPRRC
jgi:hypothetical protein